jgi:pimeloyl-ACP methyl ester carboxylesterase
VPYAENGGVRIHYKVEGSGPTLLLHHWTFASLDAWYELGYVNALSSGHRLLLMDSRAHGKSDAPHDIRAYGPELRVRDVIAVLDAAGVNQAAFFGFSMGAWIGFECARRAPERFRAFVLGGQHPYAQPMEGAREWLRVGEEDGPQAFIALWESEVGPLRPLERKRMSAYDFTAMRMAAQDRDSMESSLPEIRVPCLLFAGTNDEVYARAKKAASDVPNAQFVPLTGLRHGETMARIDLVAPLVRDFLREAHAARVNPTGRTALRTV